MRGRTTTEAATTKSTTRRWRGEDGIGNWKRRGKWWAGKGGGMMSIEGWKLVLLTTVWRKA
eukprot:9479238-Pyramimonas_sp.AAC.1